MKTEDPIGRGKNRFLVWYIEIEYRGFNLTSIHLTGLYWKLALRRHDVKDLENSLDSSIIKIVLYSLPLSKYTSLSKHPKPLLSVELSSLFVS